MRILNRFPFEKKEKLSEYVMKVLESMQQDKQIDSYQLQEYCTSIIDKAKFGPENGNDGEQRQEFRTLYTGQFQQSAVDGWLGLIKPAYFFKDKDNSKDAWKSVMLPPALRNTDPPGTLKEETPTCEECWILQEDIAVREQILHALRDAIDSAGRFNSLGKFKMVESVDVALAGPAPVGPPAAGSAPPASKAPPGPAVTIQRFRNAEWELTLHVELKNKKLCVTPGSTMKRISRIERKQPVTGLAVVLRQRDKAVFKVLEPAEACIPTQMLASNGSPLNTLLWCADYFQAMPVVSAATLLDGFDGQLPLEVEQLYFSPSRNQLPRLLLTNSNWDLDLIFEKKDASGPSVHQHAEHRQEQEPGHAPTGPVSVCYSA